MEKLVQAVAIVAVSIAIFMAIFRSFDHPQCVPVIDQRLPS